MIAAGVRLADLVPVDLYPLLWPPAAPQRPRWSTEETSNG
ncbi:hypothetical protein APASM_1597 [Actinosynnema pretiosum subsp. pretiosum]|nr:hypothetical protein APASM_1597 [Actinosynnema pretiosum subsp. pretiosum]